MIEFEVTDQDFLLVTAFADEDANGVISSAEFASAVAFAK